MKVGMRFLRMAVDSEISRVPGPVQMLESGRIIDWWNQTGRWTMPPTKMRTRPLRVTSRTRLLGKRQMRSVSMGILLRDDLLLAGLVSWAKLNTPSAVSSFRDGALAWDDLPPSGWPPEHAGSVEGRGDVPVTSRGTPRARSPGPSGIRTGPAIVGEPHRSQSGTSHLAAVAAR